MAKSYSKYIAKLGLSGKGTTVVSRGNSGIGFAFAKEAATLGYHIILAVRNLSRGESAKSKILKASPLAKVEVYELDVSKHDSVRHFVDKVISDCLDIDVFYCNAGIYRTPFAISEEGLEEQVNTNYFGNYLLYKWIKPYLLSLGHQVRFILTSSIVARFAKWDDAYFFGKLPYKKAKAYSASKLAINMFFKSLIEDCKGSFILPLLVHPGICYTPLIYKAFADRKWVLLANRLLRLFFHSPEKAALGSLYLLQEKIEFPCFVGPRGPFHLSGYPKTYHLYQGNLKGYSSFVAESEEIYKERFSLDK